MGVTLVQIFHDRQRLDENSTVVFQGRYKGLRIDFLICRAELLAATAPQMDRNLFIAQAFEIEGDANPIGSGAAKKSVKLHGCPFAVLNADAVIPSSWAQNR